MLFEAVLFVLFWIGVVALAFWVADAFGGRKADGRNAPMDIARERYARGEISREEFERVRDDLRKAA